MVRVEETHAGNISDYSRLLQSTPGEAEKLIETLTISVSMFFRNSLTFEIISQQLLPALLHSKITSGNHEFRIWSAGCATGEEPYSLSIILSDTFSRESQPFESTIFATDMDEKAIRFAKKGIYGAATMNEVKFGYLNKYFKQDGEFYKISKAVKSMVSFSRYDLLDPTNFAPPESVFGMFDMVLCRNVLIYFNPEYQEKIFYKIFRSLSPGGYLVLGESESIHAKYSNAFREINRIAKVFQKMQL